MTYAEFLQGIDLSIEDGSIKPIWWRTVRERGYRDLLRRTRLVSDVPRVPLIEGDKP